MRTIKIKKKLMKCLCKEILEAEFGEKVNNIYLHLTGCPEDYQTKEYEALVWWKKIFAHNPKKIYEIHKQVLTPP